MSKTTGGKKHLLAAKARRPRHALHIRSYSPPWRAVHKTFPGMPSRGQDKTRKTPSTPPRPRSTPARPPSAGELLSRGRQHRVTAGASLGISCLRAEASWAWRSVYGSAGGRAGGRLHQWVGKVRAGLSCSAQTLGRAWDGEWARHPLLLLWISGARRRRRGRAAAADVRGM